MNIYLIKQPEKQIMWDCYDSAVVCAENVEEAIYIHPDSEKKPIWDEKRNAWYFKEDCTIKNKDGLISTLREQEDSSWCSPKFVIIDYIGKAFSLLKSGVICASFNPEN